MAARTNKQQSKNDESNALIARKHLRQKAVEFDEADQDGDQEVDYEEFCKYVLPQTNASVQYKNEDFLEWWALMDVDGDGFIRKDEFFLYALSAASRKTGSGIAAIFRKYDEDGSGNLDEIEFEQALKEMGFGDVATVVFEEHATSEKTVSYLTLLKTVEERNNLPAMRSFLLALASDSMLKVDTSSWHFTGESPHQCRDALRALLKMHSVRLSDLFQQLDDDGSFSLSFSEFKSAMWELGFQGTEQVVSEIFCMLDQDGSGKAGFDEFTAWVSGRTIEQRVDNTERAAKLCINDRLQRSFDAGEDGWSASRLQSELNSALAEEGLRPIDLMRAWDKGTKGGDDRASDNNISSREFLVALKRMCGGGDMWYAMVRHAVSDAFARMDKSGDGAVSVSEMCRWLDPHAKLNLNLKRQATGSVVKQSAVLKGTKRAAFTEIQVSGGDDDALEQDDALSYSPTRLSIRLAQVRAFDPSTQKAGQRRVPLWKRKDEFEWDRLPRPPAGSGPPRWTSREMAAGRLWQLGPSSSQPLAPVQR